ncbi:MAG: histidine--tRNA ligase [Candidatus Rokubacteria bacterium]|nr:histidine--tRNA ligase [Candidatus Rokubacteria bacterium]
MTIRAVRGVHDILPGASATWQRVEATARRVLEAYGYREIRLPIFERTELFARGIGEVTDIVQKEMYTFEDRAGESLTLRPEATASLLRAYIEHGLHVQPKPVRLYTTGPMFRYERPQAGRYRQFHQIDAEAIGGEDQAAVDAEVVAMLVEFFKQLGLGGRVTLQINSIGDRVCRPPYRERLLAYLRANASRLCEECRERLERNPLRVLDCKRPECLPVLDGAPALLDALCADCADQFARFRRCLESMSIGYTVDPRLVRGLDYYVRTTFEVATTELGAQNAVAGGGRYDGLVELLGGPPDPATGFAIGMERVVLLLSDAGADARPLALLIPLGDDALQRLLPVAQAVRAGGVGVELGYGGRKLRGELERANKLGVAYAVIVGSDELARGEAVVREMKSGGQRTVPLDGLAAELLMLGGRA